MAAARHPPYRIEPLGDHHDRAAFSCGVEALDRYLRTRAGQDARRRIATCFVLVAAATGAVAGYYTLSAACIALADLPPEISRKLPRYPVVPATLLGRLAVDRAFRGRRIGEVLLLDAFRRCLAAEIASFACVVGATDDRALAFYERYGFRRLAGEGRRLFLPMSEIAGLFL